MRIGALVMNNYKGHPMEGNMGIVVRIGRLPSRGFEFLVWWEDGYQHWWREHQLEVLCK